MTIEYDAVVGSGAGQWYGQIIVSHLRHEDGSAVQVNQYLALTFNAPAAISDTDIYMSFAQSWVSTGVSVQSAQIDSNLFSISATLDFAAPHLMDVNDQITISVNGDLTKDPDTYLDS